MAKAKYGAAHQKLRAAIAAQVAAGGVICWRCRQPIPPASRWELGHNEDGSAYMGPEHFTCNRTHGGRKGRAAQMRATKARDNGPSRNW